MSSEIDPKVVRDFARRAILSAAEEVDYIGIAEQFGDDENWPPEEAAYDAMHEAVNAEWKKATVTVSWPDEQPQDERDARIAELEREVRQLRAGAPRAWKTDWRDPISRFENFVNATRNYDSDHLGGIMRGGKAEATITLGDLRAVLARLAELEARPNEPLRPEYGIRADFTDTTSAEFTVAETLDEALRALDEFDAKHGDRAVSRELMQRPVGEWRKVGDVR